MFKYSILYFAILFIIFSSGCSTMQCNKFGTIEYCSPKLNDSIETIKKDFKNTKTKSEKEFDYYQKSNLLSKKWFKTINNVKEFLLKNNIELYATPIKVSGEGLSNNNKAIIKIIHKDDNVTLEFDDKFKKNLEKEYILSKIIYGKKKLKENPELLYKFSPSLRAVIQLIKSKKLIANQFNIIVGSSQLAKLLSKYYTSYEHNVYIVKQNISPHIDIKANLYLPSNLVNSNTLDLIMLHEAFHLIPVGINNQYIQNRFLKAFSSKRFLSSHKNIISNTPQTYNVNNINEKDGLAINPSIYNAKFIKMLGNTIKQSGEIFIDMRVLLYIKNDYTQCIKYYNILKQYNIDKSEDIYQRQRLPLIFETCNYIKKGYSFNYMKKNIEMTKKTSKIVQEFISTVGENSNIDQSLRSVLKKLISEEYKNKDEQNIMFLWYYTYLSTTLNDVLKNLHKDNK